MQASAETQLLIHMYVRLRQKTRCRLKQINNYSHRYCYPVKFVTRRAFVVAEMRFTNRADYYLGRRALVPDCGSSRNLVLVATSAHRVLDCQEEHIHVSDWV